MEEKRRRFPLSVYEVVLLVIMIPIIFYYSEKLLWTIGESGTEWRPRWFIIFLGLLLEKPWNPIGPLSILGFDFLWIIAMKLWPLKKQRIKIYSTLLLFTVSAAILTMWLVGNMFRGWISS
ncbi:MAG: hypothetical protein ABSH16_02030 [Sedimentisphaerales bacterium]